VLTFRHGRGRGARTISLPFLLALSLGALAAAPAHASLPQSHRGQHGASTSPAAVRRAGAGGLSPAEAAERAGRTGRRVTVSALTTPNSATTVSPDGTFTVTQSLVPVRAWRGGHWRPLDATLRANRNGTISPAVTTTPLVLSGGGRAPLAVLASGPRQLSLSWPRPLPAPAISGATATYRNVLPGVNLVLTADTQGGFSDVVVVTSARAAANPALRSLRLTVTAKGLVLSASKAGNLTAAAGRTAPPLFTAQPPLAWDSAPPPARMPTSKGPGGIVVNRATGMPAYSSVTAPGAAARVARVPVTLAGHALTLSPPASVLTGRHVTYPVYIDPTWYSVGTKASDWTQVDKGYPTTTYWNEGSDLQIGQCPASISPPGACGPGNGVEVARSFVRVPIPSALTSSTQINNSFMYMTNVSSPSCTATAAQLWTTGGIGSGTDWNNQPGWNSEVQSKSFAYGYTGCGYKANNVTWDITSIMQRDAADNYTNQTFGIRAANESDNLGWKQFWSGAKNITTSTQYNDPPNNPTARATSPGGSCQYSASAAPVIGNDDVTFSAAVSDNDGDNSLTTRFLILNSSGSTVYDTKTAGTSVVTGNKTTARLILARSVMQGLQSGGNSTEFTYHWYAITTDDNGLNSNTPADDCYFKYNPLGPSAPTITVPASGQLGQSVAATFTAPPNCSPTTSPCPVSYVYQTGAHAPVTVTADGGGNWSGTIAVSQVGPIDLTVYALATGGNPGESATAEFLGTAPATPYADGYFSGGSYPDLLTLGTGAKPSLWLRPGTGNGAVGPATDIGSLGTGLNPGTDGPGDWAGATVLHGDFTGDGVQDVMAYYPTTGNGVIIAGNGNASSLAPVSGNVSFAQSGLMASGDTGDTPGQALVGAGNASELSTGTDDMIGVSGDSTNGYELDLYTNGLCAGCAFAGGYGWDETLATQAPDGTADWQNYALATAQPGGNPGATVLFALDKSTGALYESTNPSQSATSVIGSGNWAQLSVPWGASPPTLVSADVNQAGKTELWTLSGGTATAYLLNGSALGGEGAGSPANAPTNDWALTDGSPVAQTGTATTATDSVTGSTATLTSGVTWGDDDYFSADASFDGQTGYLTPPSGTIPGSDTTPSISVWFKTTATDGVLVSVQSQALSAGSTTSGGYNPVIYIGTDGKLRAEWWNGNAGAPIASTAAVNDGLWHHAVLTATGNTQYLDIDGKLQGTLPGTVILASLPNLNFGAGYIGGSWPTEPHYKQSGNTGYLDYFNGELADITASSVPAVTGGYWAYTAKGNIYNEGGAGWWGSQANNITNGAGLAITPDGAGYWLVTATGTVYAYGDATTGTSVPGPACPVIGAVGNPTGGYYAYTACGNIYNEGGAVWYGSQAGKITNGAGLAVTADGGGYWLITASGTVYAYGDATTGTSISPACSIIGAAGDPAGGYFAYTACGNVYQEAGAVWDGSEAGAITNGAGLAVTADGGGYWLITTSGTVYAYGDATGGTSVSTSNTLAGAVGSPAR
jgi:Concanavalin A-like lectin/glucanases superfamily